MGISYDVEYVTHEHVNALEVITQAAKEFGGCYLYDAAKGSWKTVVCVHVTNGFGFEVAMLRSGFNAINNDAEETEKQYVN